MSLTLPRTLAIQLLHEAQIAQPEPIRGWVLASNGQPSRWCADETAPENASVWARLWSHPTAPAVPSPDELRPGELSLLISLNTKGVLELRAWELVAGQVCERAIGVDGTQAR